MRPFTVYVSKGVPRKTDPKSRVQVPVSIGTWLKEDPAEAALAEFIRQVNADINDRKITQAKNWTATVQWLTKKGAFREERFTASVSATEITGVNRIEAESVKENAEKVARATVHLLKEEGYIDNLTERVFVF